ncbi:MAG: C-type lectin domain-containing protein, partial [Phycisphaerales bacterium]
MMHSSGEPTSAELSAMLRAARTVGRTQVARRTGVAAIALLATFAASAAISTEFSGFHHAGAHSAFLTPRGEIVRPRDGTPHEEMKMRGFNGVMAGAALALSSSALAQNAVQWRVEDGGNGHWYRTIVHPSSITWEAARDACASNGGHLVTVTGPGESSFVRSVGSVAAAYEYFVGPWLGGYQDRNAPNYLEPMDGWRWVTNETW